MKIIITSAALIMTAGVAAVPQFLQLVDCTYCISGGGTASPCSDLEPVIAIYSSYRTSVNTGADSRYCCGTNKVIGARTAAI